MCVHTCSCIGFDVMSGLAKDQDLTFYLQMPLLLSNIKGFKKDFVWFQKPKGFPKRSTHCFKTNLKRKCVVWFKTLNALFSKSKGLEKVLRRVRTMPLFPGIFRPFLGLNSYLLEFYLFSRSIQKSFRELKLLWLCSLSFHLSLEIFMEFFGAQRYFSEPK